jgi:hypothetical protein
LTEKPRISNKNKACAKKKKKKMIFFVLAARAQRNKRSANGGDTKTNSLCNVMNFFDE